MNKQLLKWYFIVGNIIFTLIVGAALVAHYGFWLSLFIGSFLTSLDYLKFRKELWMNEQKVT